MTKVCKIVRVQCFVVNSENNERFENILSMLMVPVKAFDETTNTYEIYVTIKLWTYIVRECRFREIEVLPQQGFRKDVVNREEYQKFHDEVKAEKKR